MKRLENLRSCWKRRGIRHHRESPSARLKRGEKVFETYNAARFNGSEQRQQTSGRTRGFNIAIDSSYPVLSYSNVISAKLVPFNQEALMQ